MFSVARFFFAPIVRERFCVRQGFCIRREFWRGAAFRPVCSRAFCSGACGGVLARHSPCLRRDPEEHSTQATGRPNARGQDIFVEGFGVARRTPTLTFRRNRRWRFAEAEFEERIERERRATFEGDNTRGGRDQKGSRLAAGVQHRRHHEDAIANKAAQHVSRSVAQRRLHANGDRKSIV